MDARLGIGEAQVGWLAHARASTTRSARPASLSARVGYFGLPFFQVTAWP